jgi:hypothetical protein
VAAALDIIALAHAPLPMARAAALVRSPHIAGAANDWLLRARHEAEWLCEGRRELSLARARRCDGCGGPDAGTAAARRERGSAGDRDAASLDGNVAGGGSRPRDGPASARFRRSSGRHERPGMTSWPSSRRWGRWRGGSTAARRLRRSLRSPATSCSNPESPPASIQILGGLEAAGLPFDALWVAGLAAERWPPAPRPNPLLPLAWQRNATCRDRRPRASLPTRKR